MSTYEDGLKDDQWSNLCCLADAATMVYHEEQRLRKGKSKKTVSDQEVEEDSELSFFRNLPRQTRSSVARRKTQNPYQKLNGASTTSSSSLLPDLNLIPCDSETNHLRLQWLSPSETKNPQNPSCFEPSSSPLLHTEMKNPQNPNNSQSSLCKRRAVQERKSKGLGFKKAKVVPEYLVQIVRDMNVAENPRLIFEKILSEIDVNPKERRFSIPFSTLIRNDFLTPMESKILKNEKKNEVGAILVNQKSVKWGVMFKQWKSKKDSGSYGLTCGWKDFVKANDLKIGDNVSLWSFRWQQVLCFALLVTPPPTIAQSSTVETM